MMERERVGLLKASPSSITPKLISYDLIYFLYFLSTLSTVPSVSLLLCHQQTRREMGSVFSQCHSRPLPLVKRSYFEVHTIGLHHYLPFLLATFSVPLLPLKTSNQFMVCLWLHEQVLIFSLYPQTPTPVFLLYPSQVPCIHLQIILTFSTPFILPSNPKSDELSLPISLWLHHTKQLSICGEVTYQGWVYIVTWARCPTAAETQHCVAVWMFF